jgi:hypothetical protein
MICRTQLVPVSWFLNTPHATRTSAHLPIGATRGRVNCAYMVSAEHARMAQAESRRAQGLPRERCCATTDTARELRTGTFAGFDATSGNIRRNNQMDHGSPWGDPHNGPSDDLYRGWECEGYAPDG